MRILFAALAVLAACGDSGPATDAEPVRYDARECGAPPNWCDAECSEMVCGDPSLSYCECSGGEWSDMCPQSASCNPIAQTGCATGEKCAYMLCAPGSFGTHYVGCADDGDVAVGDACTEPTEGGHADDCARGGHCYDGVCRAVCTTVNPMCEGGESCEAVADIVELCLGSGDAGP